MISIQQLSQEVGIGVDTLRIWERRYNFPVPKRDSRGHRCYPAKQVEELRVVKRLQNLGYRPNRIFALSSAERRDLLKNELAQVLPQVDTMQRLTIQLAPEEIDRELRSQLKKMGLVNFVHRIAVPLIHALDRGWTDGSLSIAREHLVSDRLEQLLKEQLRMGAQNNRNARLLFLTLSGERHKLGLLLAAVLFHHEEIDCILLHEELPLLEVPQLAEDLQVSGVALSFSAHYSSRQAKKDLASLRNNLDQRIKLIAGGSAVRRGVQMQNLIICTELQRIPELCKINFQQTDRSV